MICVRCESENCRCNDGATVFCGAAEEFHFGVTVPDLLLCDPPYGIGEAAKRNASRSKLAAAKNYTRRDWDSQPVDQRILDRLIAGCRRSIVWGGNFYSFPAASCWLVWDKQNGASDFADCELAWTNLPGAVRKFTWRWAGMLQQNMKRKERRFHQTQKPLELMKWAINRANLRPGSLVLDPFAGSGTVAVASRDLGHRSISLDIVPEYCEIIRQRLALPPAGDAFRNYLKGKQ